MEFIWIAIGLALLGYFIGDGLKNFGNPKQDSSYYYFIKENELQYYINLSETEIQELLLKYPGAPKISLNSNTYYSLRRSQDWLYTLELNNK